VCVCVCAHARVRDVAVRFIALQLHAKAVLNNGDVLAKVTCFVSVVI